MADKNNKFTNQRQSKKSQKAIAEQAETTVLRTVGLSGTVNGGAEAAVDVKDGKILRIRPLHYDWKYDKKDLNPWKFQRNGKTLEPNWKSLPGPYSLAYKKRVYSPNRIKYPLKRVDWDPNGERNPQNRGKSKYKRISWDEATDIIASEIKRVRKKYGPLGDTDPGRRTWRMQAGAGTSWPARTASEKAGGRLDAADQKCG